MGGHKVDLGCVSQRPDALTRASKTDCVAGKPSRSQYNNFCNHWLISISIITVREPLLLQQPGSSDAPAGAHREHSCRSCNKAVGGQDAKKLGHSCWLYFVAHGKDPSLYEHTNNEAGKYKADLSQAEAVQLLAAKLSKNSRHKRNAAKRKRDGNV